MCPRNWLGANTEDANRCDGERRVAGRRSSRVAALTIVWTRLAIVLVVLALVALIAWQADEYGHERDLARQTVSSSADSIMNALVGGIRSHRRLGYFFAQNIQGVLDGLADSRDVRAVAVVSIDGTKAVTAGERSLLHLQPPLVAGGTWEGAGYCLVTVFTLPTESPGVGHDGLGSGRGQGWRRQQEESEHSSAAFAAGEKVAAILLLDRQRADEACYRAAWLRGSIVVAGTLLILCVAVAWQATVRLVRTKERERALEMEAHHYRDLSQAAAGLAHEIRNPLGLVRGWTQRFVQEGFDAPDGPRHAQAIIEECDRITARINQFLAFAKNTEPHLTRFNPTEVHRELADLLATDSAGKQVEIVLHACEATIEADREMYRQAMFNLLNNAVQASPSGTAVEVRIERNATDTYRVEVADHGPGVAAEHVERLFTPYFTTRADGTGLGLAITRRIAAAHGWTVTYRPRSGGGAVFVMDGIHG